MSSRIRYILVSLACLTLAGCSQIFEEPLSTEPQMVSLNLKIGQDGMDNTPSPAMEGRAPSFDDQASAREQMQELRVIIVRPDGKVEHNQYFDLAAPVLFKTANFKVRANEKKEIYVFVNEHSKDAMDLTLVNCRLDEIQVGKFFPTAEMHRLQIQPSGLESEQSSEPIPMNAYYEIQVGKTDVSQSIWVLRSMIKVSFNVTNNGTQPMKLSKLVLGPIATRSYYFPHKEETVLHRNIDGREWLITDFVIPSSNESLDYNYDFILQHPTRKACTIPVGKTVSLPPIYLLENRVEAAVEHPYRTSLKINGFDFTSPLPNTPGKIVRNTHLVINITLNDRQMTARTDLIPYWSCPLEPEFGI